MPACGTGSAMDAGGEGKTGDGKKRKVDANQTATPRRWTEADLTTRQGPTGAAGRARRTRRSDHVGSRSIRPSWRPVHSEGLPFIGCSPW